MTSSRGWSPEFWWPQCALEVAWAQHPAQRDPILPAFLAVSERTLRLYHWPGGPAKQHRPTDFSRFCNKGGASRLHRRQTTGRIPDLASQEGQDSPANEGIGGGTNQAEICLRAGSPFGQRRRGRGKGSYQLKAAACRLLCSRRSRPGETGHSARSVSDWSQASDQLREEGEIPRWLSKDSFSFLSSAKIWPSNRSCRRRQWRVLASLALCDISPDR